MGVLYTVSDFLKLDSLSTGAISVDRFTHAAGLADRADPNRVKCSEATATYWYEGVCPQSDRLLRLPRTPLAEAIAQGLMRQLGGASASPDRNLDQIHNGKMYGILLVALPSGEYGVLKAFSGLLNGHGEVAGWVPPLPGRGQIALAEAHTLERLEGLKQQLIAFKQRPEQHDYTTLLQTCRVQLQELGDRHRDRKQQRQHQRQILCNTVQGEALALALETLNQQSQQDGIERRRLKQQQTSQIQPLAQKIEQIEIAIRTLKQQRKDLSRQLQTQMHNAYWMTNFLGESRSLQQVVMGDAMPTGTGDCCAPKLLHYAATHHLTPLAMAEFWWGADSPKRDKVQGEFYGACSDRCQPLMGFLLAGLSPSGLSDTPPDPLKNGGFQSGSPVFKRNWEANPFLQVPTSDSYSLDLAILYEDDWLIAVNKPAGLLSVPGRYRHTQDSVLSRLQWLHSQHQLSAVHRLDQDTSGILLLARHRDTHRNLSLQFQQRQVHKVYEALLAGSVTIDDGVIELPVWGDPQHAPYQRVDWARGKPSTTQFRKMGTVGTYTRMELIPLTGRTHQLRVHTADSRGLGVPIVGDRLYGITSEGAASQGAASQGDRLYLHARELTIQHPHSQQTLHLQTQTPF